MKKISLSLSLAALLGLSLPLPSLAASEAECAIWLCLPAGFPDGCGAAKSAFKKRLRKGRSPLPPFSQCAVDEHGNRVNADDFRVEEKSVLHIKEHKQCTQKQSRTVRDDVVEECVREETVAEHYEDGSSCYITPPSKDDPGELKPGCAGSFQEITIFDKDGKQVGDSYRYGLTD